jgi:hypothetical protein
LAQEGIYLKQSTGDMRVNHIESRNGDVELFAPNGNIVDASDAESVSNTPSRVQSWIDAGLISAEDADDSKAKISGEIQESTKKNLEIRFSQLTGKMENRTVDGYKSAAAEYSDAVNSARSAYVQTLRSSAAADADKKAAKAAYEKAQRSSSTERTTRRKNRTPLSRTPKLYGTTLYRHTAGRKMSSCMPSRAA